MDNVVQGNFGKEANDKEQMVTLSPETLDAMEVKINIDPDIIEEHGISAGSIKEVEKECNALLAEFTGESKEKKRKLQDKKDKAHFDAKDRL